jgi:two-component system response regulator DesR
MLVDDEADVRILLETLFGMEGFEVVASVGDGDEAVPAALDAQPDVIVLDFMMPRLDGGETAAFLRAVAPRARIIAFSGIIHACPEWADDFIEKGGVAEVTELARRVMQKEPKPAPESAKATLAAAGMIRAASPGLTWA